MAKPLLFTLIFFLFLANAHSQTTPILERKVTFSAQNERLDLFLRRLSQDAGCVFSYSPSTIDVTGNVTGTFSNLPLREILEVVFEGNVQLKSKGVYVILTPKPESSKEITVSGYVVDESGKGIRDATVYDPITLKSSTTDEYGYFQFAVKNPAAENFELVVNKKDFSDTLVLDNSSRSFQKILLKSEDLGKSLAEPMKNFWVWTKNSVGFTNLENVSDTIHRGFQFSVVPFVGTNRKISGSVVNDFSLNLLGGFSGGTEKAELGGLFNITKGDAGIIQVAGLFNQVGGQIRGLQLAGVVNSAMDSVKAAHIAGVSNFTTGNVSGFQLAGVLNLATRNVQGSQIAGVLNYTHRDVTGVQFAPVLNIARKVTGSQIGLINYSDSTTGAPIGLISIVRRGYHKLEIGTDEMLPLNVSIRTGTRSFYNILFAGMRPEQADSTTWAFGYGIGSSPRLGKKTYLNVELSSQQLNKGNVLALNLVNRAYLGFDWQTVKGLGLFAGPTLNWRVYDSSYTAHPETFSYFTPEFLSENTYPDQDLASQLWFGFRAGVRFF